MFADLVGFTAFSQMRGEEAAFRLMQALAQMMSGVVDDFGGSVQGFTGDGIMAVFGAPRAYEDAPVRACRAALGIVEKLQLMRETFERDLDARPQIRIGLNVGPVVMAEFQGRLTVLGDTVNFASRLQALAAPDTVAISEALHQLLGSAIEDGLVGDKAIKGREGSEKVYRLARVTKSQSRSGVEAGRMATTFLGREREVESLESAVEGTVASSLTVDIVGDPGIGKSRLVKEFLSSFQGRRMRVLTGFCSQERVREPLGAFVDLIRDVFRIETGEEYGKVVARFEEGLRPVGLGSAEDLALMMNLLGIEPRGDALAALDGVLIGLRTRTLLRHLLWSRARLTPTILVLEDLHWADNASLELMQSLVEAEEPSRLVLITTRRPEMALPWGQRAGVLKLDVAPLSARDIGRIACERLKVAELPKDVSTLILARAEGNPLFAEEVSAYIAERRLALVEQPSANLAAAAVGLPHSLQSLLASRVDQVTPSERAALQVAAVIGRSFHADVAIEIAAREDVTSVTFQSLTASGLLLADEGEDDLTFKHALLRDAIYDTLLTEQKEKLHRAIGDLLQARGANRLTEIAGALAHHFQLGRDPIKAFRFLVMAGQKSLSVYAVQEAETYFREALELRAEGGVEPASLAPAVVHLLEALLLQSNYKAASLVAEANMPTVKKYGERETFVIAAYYQTLSLVQGLKLREANRVINEAVEVARELDDSRSQAYALGALLQCRTRLGLDNFEAAQKLKSEVTMAAEHCKDNFIRNASYFFVIWDYFYRGLFREARALAIDLIASGEVRGDPRASGFAHWILGWIDLADGALNSALARADECIRVAIAPFDRMQGEIIRALVDVLGDRPAEGLAKIEGLNREFTRLGALYNVLEGPRGAALMSLGRFSEGAEVLRKAIRGREDIGDRTMAAFSQILMAEIYIRILRRERKAPLRVLLKNLGFVLDAALFGRRRALRLLAIARANPQFHANGVAVGRIEFNLGLLEGMRGNKGRAAEKFKMVSRIARDQENDILLSRVAKAEAELLGGGLT